MAVRRDIRGREEGVEIALGAAKGVECRHDVLQWLVEYRSWLFTTLVQQLLAATAIEPEAVADLSFGGLA